jgi:hypothetical protein
MQESCIFIERAALTVTNFCFRQVYREKQFQSIMQSFSLPTMHSGCESS